MINENELIAISSDPDYKEEVREFKTNSGEMTTIFKQDKVLVSDLHTIWEFKKDKDKHFSIALFDQYLFSDIDYKKNKAFFEEICLQSKKDKIIWYYHDNYDKAPQLSQKDVEEIVIKKYKKEVSCYPFHHLKSGDAHWDKVKYYYRLVKGSVAKGEPTKPDYITIEHIKKAYHLRAKVLTPLTAFDWSNQARKSGKPLEVHLEEGIKKKIDQLDRYIKDARELFKDTLLYNVLEDELTKIVTTKKIEQLQVQDIAQKFDQYIIELEESQKNQI